MNTSLRTHLSLTYAAWRGLIVALLLCATSARAAATLDDPIADWLAERGHLAQSVRDRAADLVLSALQFVGVPYLQGGADARTGFDCSGFTRHIFAQTLGLALPRSVDDQAGAAGLTPVTRQDLRPGDLVFFNTLRRTFSHVGIYVGDGRFVHAPRSGSLVRIEDMRFAYWDQRFTGARRAADAGRPDAARAEVPGR